MLLIKYTALSGLLVAGQKFGDYFQFFILLPAGGFFQQFSGFCFWHRLLSLVKPPGAACQGKAAFRAAWIFLPPAEDQ